MAKKSPPAAVEPPELLSYRVTTPLNHNGDLYQVDELVDLTPDEFARLNGVAVTDQPVDQTAAG